MPPAAAEAVRVVEPAWPQPEVLRSSDGARARYRAESRAVVAARWTKRRPDGMLACPTVVSKQQGAALRVQEGSARAVQEEPVVQAAAGALPAVVPLALPSAQT